MTLFKNKSPMFLCRVFRVVCLITCFITCYTTKTLHVELKDANASILTNVRHLETLPDTLHVEISSLHHNGTFVVKKYENALGTNVPVHITAHGVKSESEVLANNIVCYRAHNDGYDVNVALWVASSIPGSLKETRRIMLDLIIQNISTVLTGEVNLDKQEYNFMNWYTRNDVMKSLYENKHDLNEKPTKSTSNAYFNRHDGKTRNKRATRESNLANVRYVETFVIVDSSFFNAMNQSVANTTSKVVQIINSVDTLYSRLNIRVVLVAIDIWKDNDLMPISTSATETLQNLTLYGEKIRHVDNIQLLTVRSFTDNIQGLGYVGGMCSFKYSMGINTLKQHRPMSDIITVMAHEMGHNFNMNHDDENPRRACACAGNLDYCIMDSANHPVSAMHWSDCSMESAKAYLESSKTTCLQNKPDTNIASTGVCGNNIKEDGEECDCGDEQYCDDACCNPATCKLINDAQCSSGPCCQACQRVSNGTTCRVSNDECDIADTCDATGDCHNRYKEDGTPCDKERGICHRGVCHSRETQCQSVWGQGTQDGSSDCYKTLNTIGEFYGHCGGSEDNYTKCAQEDVYCGLLQCDDPSRNKPIIGTFLQSSRATIRTGDTQHTCKGVSIDLGRQQRDPGMVLNWTPCGDNHYCLDTKCVHHLFKTKCDQPCNGDNQVCDDNGACVTLTTTDSPQTTTWYISTYFDSAAGRIAGKWVIMIGNISLMLLLSFGHEAIPFEYVLSALFRY